MCSLFSKSSETSYWTLAELTKQSEITINPLPDNAWNKELGKLAQAYIYMPCENKQFNLAVYYRIKSNNVMGVQRF